MPWGRYRGGPCQVQPGEGGILPQVPCLGGTLPGGVPCQEGYPARGYPAGWGYPARGTHIGYAPPGRVHPPPWPGQDRGRGSQIGQQNDYSIHGGRYASCVHAGGLSCWKFFRLKFEYFQFKLIKLSFQVAFEYQVGFQLFSHTVGMSEMKVNKMSIESVSDGIMRNVHVTGLGEV